MRIDPGVWRWIVRIAGGVHTLGHYDLVIHDHGVIFCSGMVVRSEWRIGKSAVR